MRVLSEVNSILDKFVLEPNSAFIGGGGGGGETLICTLT